MSEIKNAMYLGDSVYVGIESGMVVLYTDNGGEPKNKIFLESGVMLNLLAWWNKMRDE